MEPSIETAEVKLVGVQAIVRVDRDFVQDLEKLYARLFDRLDGIPDLSPLNRTVGYWYFVDNETRLYLAGVQIDGAYYGANFDVETGQALDYLVGMAVGDMHDVPVGLTLREVPASHYAVFECTVKTISDTYDWIFGQWLPTASYGRPGKGSPKADFERYPPATDSGDTPVLLHIALEDEPKEKEGSQ